ncbi:MAG: amidohydrolase family protein [Ignavibacteriales bacterium]|nr:amidohydrolase family protein [Ignavibacteriales bacterium]
MKSFTVTNAFFASIDNSSIVPVFGDATIVNGKITKIIPKRFDPALFNNTENDTTTYNAAGRVITAPLTNFHDHIYSRLAKGLPLSGDFSNFENILTNLWWKLDCFLDLPMITASAKMTALESIRNGVTYIVDHHSSQVHTENSLVAIRESLDQFSLRSVLCFETSCRNGENATKAGLMENMNYLRAQNDNHKALFGLHAAFTLDDATLEETGRFIREHSAGIHIHLYEDHADRKNSNAKFGASPVDRLLKFGLLNKKSILAHGLFLEKAELEKIKQFQPALVLNIDSNMNNAVGLPPFGIGLKELTILAGTDGMHANLARSLKQIFLAARVQGLSTDEAFGLVNHIYFGQMEFIKQFFPDFTTLQTNSAADFIVWDYVPPTPLTANNFWGHYIYGILENPVCTVVQNGDFLIKDYSMMVGDEGKIHEEIYKEGSRLYNLFAQNIS